MPDVIKAIDECINIAEKIRFMVNNKHNPLPITNFRRCINRMMPLISDSKLNFASIIENNEKNLLNNYGILNPYSFGAIVCILPLCKEYFRELTSSDKKDILTNKKSKIFISHSTIYIEYVRPFIVMLEKIGIKSEHLFCSSVQGYGVPFNENIYSYIQQQFNNNDLYVIYILSKNYYSSAACLNEMGAAWILKADYQSILLPSFDFNDIKGAIDPSKISFKLDTENDCRYRLTELKEKIFDKINIPPIASSHWERVRDEFLEEIAQINKKK